MNYSLTDLQREITQEIERAQANNAPILHPDWITNAIMLRHSAIDGTDADFHRCCSRISVRRETAQLLNKTHKPLGDERQLSLEGMSKLQHYYLVKRGEDRVSVRIDLLTDTELDEKAAEYEAMGKACMAHARALLRYKTERREEGKAS